MGTAVTVPGKRPRGLIRKVIDSLIGADKPKRAPSPFEAWDFERARDEIERAFDAQTIDVSLSEGASVAPVNNGQTLFYPRRSNINPIIVNRLFFRGDHWQNGDGWVGPHPEATSPHFNDTMSEIANIFTSKNVVRETTLRHALGVIGRNMQWGFAPVDEPEDPTGKPSDEIQTKIKEATRLIRPWLQNRKVQTLLRDAICTLLLAERAGIQLTIPTGLAEKDADGNLIIETDSIGEALNFIYPEHPLPDNAAVVNDRNTKQEAGIWRYTTGKDEAEDTLSGGGESTVTAALSDEKEYVAICFVDELGETVTRVFAEGEDDVVTQAELSMGGRIPMFEMRRAALITLQVQQAQRALNLAETMIPRAAVTQGFIERLLIDTQMPGEPELDDDGNETGRWIEKPFYVGAGTTNFLQSTEYLDEEGKTKRATGQAIFRPPVPADGAIAASDKHYRSILDETGQLHVVMAGDSNPSGSSRLTARIEYLATLQLTQGEVEAAFRFIVDTALAMAEAIAQQPGHYTNFIRCQVACRLDAGPLLPAERQAIETSIGKTISQETAMMLVGIEDVDAERIRMSLDPLSRASYGATVGDALNKLTAPGATLEGAAQFIGVHPSQVALLMGGRPGPLQAGGTNGEPTGTRKKDEKKADDEPSTNQRGPGVPGPDKMPLPTPATSSSGTSSGAGLPISGAK